MISGFRKLFAALSGSLVLSLLLTGGALGLFLFGTDRVVRDSDAERRRALESAVQRDITSCYALEGAYPPDLQYLKDHYGLTWDESRYFVDYRPVASNIRPFYVIIEVSNANAK